MLTILLFLVVLFSIYFVVSYFQVKNSKKSFEFIYHWAWWMGAFVWEDLLIFSALYVFFVSIVFLTHDLRIGLLLFIVFWIIRSIGETLYYFLQQFIQPQHDPHKITSHFSTMSRFLGEISEQKSMIILQVILQSVTILAVTSLVLLAINWSQIPQWF